MDAPAGTTRSRPDLGSRAVRVQGLLIGILVLWAVALLWHFTRHQVAETCGDVGTSNVCVQRTQTLWSPFGPREDDVRVQVDVEQCGTTYPSPLSPDEEMHVSFRAHSVVLAGRDGEEFSYPTGPC